VTNTNVLYGLRASNFFQSAGRALLLASRFHGRVPSLHAQDLVWVFVHRFLSKVLKAPDSCLVSVYDLVPTCIGQCHIIALEVQCLFKTSFSFTVPTCCTPFPEQGCASPTGCSGHRAHSSDSYSWRITSSVRPDLISDRHRGQTDDHTAPVFDAYPQIPVNLHQKPSALPSESATPYTKQSSKSSALLAASLSPMRNPTTCDTR
jgi:hypothetical protein